MYIPERLQNLACLSTKKPSCKPSKPVVWISSMITVYQASICSVTPEYLLAGKHTTHDKTYYSGTSTCSLQFSQEWGRDRPQEIWAVKTPWAGLWTTPQQGFLRAKVETHYHSWELWRTSGTSLMSVSIDFLSCKSIKQEKHGL